MLSQEKVHLPSRETIFKQIVPKGKGILTLILHSVELNDTTLLNPCCIITNHTQGIHKTRTLQTDESEWNEIFKFEVSSIGEERFEFKVLNETIPNESQVFVGEVA